MKMEVNNKFDMFCFIKKVLVAAKNAGWTHLPEHDRYISDQITFAFSKDEGEKNRIELDLVFDLCEMDVVKSGVARWTSQDGVRILCGKDIIFVEIEDFFNPKSVLNYGEVERV